MALGLDDAVLSWLVAAAGGGLVSRLRDPVRAAMREVVKKAVDAAVDSVAGHLDEDRTEHLREALLVRDANLDASEMRVTSEAELRNAMHAWTTALDERVNGQRYLTERGVNPRQLADTLATEIKNRIEHDGRLRKELRPLAEWLWRDDTTTRLARIEEKIETFAVHQEPHGGGLPGGTPDFTGRQQALDKMAAHVETHDPADTVVAIHSIDGMAGIGKTELAVRAAHQHKRRYPDGQYFINLHGYTDGIQPMRPEVALEELLRQAGIPGQQIPPNVAGRQARWQALMATRRALVLLDNALDIDQVRPLLPHSASCLVLITSRSRLHGLPGAKALRLDVPPHDEAVELFTRLVHTSRRLDPHAVATVVDLVGRLPVAVQAVAGLVDDRYTETDLAYELADANTAAGLLDQASGLDVGVRAAFSTSLRRLDQPHLQAFRTLGVHPGPSVGVPQFAALADLPIASARAMLRRLADRNLITATDDRVGHHRYQLHDLMRAFARSQATSHLTAGQRSAATARLTTWYVAAMSAIERLRHATDPDPNRSQVEGLDLDRPAAAHLWMATEQDNLVAFAEAVTDGPAAEVCQQAARNLSYFNYYTSARVLYQTAAGIYQRVDNRVGLAAACRDLGNVARATGDYPGAAEHYRAAQATFAEIGDKGGQAAALKGLGDVARQTGDRLGAEDYYIEAQTIFPKLRDRVRQSSERLRLGDVARAAGDYPGAAEHYRAAQTTFAEIGDKGGQAIVSQRLGDVARAAGDYPSAAENYRAAQAAWAAIPDRHEEAAALVGLGHVAKEQGRRDEAREQWEAALRIYEQFPHFEEASVRDLLGRLEPE